MMKTLVLAASAAFITIGAASADASPTAQDTSELREIVETVCAANQKVVFFPVSHDQKVLRETYAVVPASNLTADSASIVTPTQRAWLERNGCNAPKSVDVFVSKAVDKQS